MEVPLCKLLPWHRLQLKKVAITSTGEMDAQFFKTVALHLQGVQVYTVMQVKVPGL